MAYPRPGPPMGSRRRPSAGRWWPRVEADFHIKSADFPEGTLGTARRPGALPPDTDIALIPPPTPQKHRRTIPDNFPDA